MRRALAALAIALAAPAGAAEVVAVADLDFVDSSGEVADPEAASSARSVSAKRARRAA